MIPPTAMNTHQYNLRNRNNRQIPNTRLSIYAKSFIPSASKIWNTLPPSLRNTDSLSKFKNDLSKIFFPPIVNIDYNRLCIGKNGIFLTRIRLGLSALNAQRFKYNLIDSPSCDHCTQDETPIHYFIYCPAYSDHRNIFKNRLQAELSIDISDKQKLLNTILHGLNNTVTNKILIDIVNEFMTLTKRFC